MAQLPRQGISWDLNAVRLFLVRTGSRTGIPGVLSERPVLLLDFTRLGSGVILHYIACMCVSVSSIGCILIGTGCLSEGGLWVSAPCFSVLIGPASASGFTEPAVSLLTHFMVLSVSCPLFLAWPDQPQCRWALTQTIALLPCVLAVFGGCRRDKARF